MKFFFITCLALLVAVAVAVAVAVLVDDGLWSGRRGLESTKFTTGLPGMVGLSSIGLVVWVF